MNLASKKMLAAAIAAMLALVVFSLPVSTGSADSEDSLNLGSDSTTTTSIGTFNVYFYDGDNWSSTNVIAYDGYKALRTSAVRALFDAVASDGNEFWNKSDSSGYSNPNENYGAIDTIDGDSISNYSIYVYVDNQWAIANPALGWYRPFVDYASVTSSYGSMATANIAVVYGTSMPSSIAEYISDGNALASLTSVSSCSYSFYLKDATASIDVSNMGVKVRTSSSGDADVDLTNTMLRSGVTIYGCGSDAFLAFKNCFNLGSAVSGVMNAPGIEYAFETYSYWEYYSWIYTVLGAGTIQTAGQDTPSDWTDDHHTYWSTYTSASPGSSSYAQYTLGYYSTISGAPNNEGSSFSVIYETS